MPAARLSPRHYSDEEKAFFREFTPGHSRQEINDAFNERFTPPITLGQTVSFIKNNHLNTGRTGKFEAGHQAWNKGLAIESFMSAEAIERSKAGRFTAGAKPHNARAIGEERIAVDGYTQVHVSDDPALPMYKRWVMKHRLVWESHHGRPVPANHVILFADRDKQNFDIENLVLASRSEMITINKLKIDYFDRKSLDLALQIVRVRKTCYAIDAGKASNESETKGNR